MAWTLEQSYSHCRQVAKTRAGNFYRSFALLPPERRDAMCAIYAFMRRADDIADDGDAPVPERRREIARWRARVHGTLSGGSSDEAALPAFRDTTERYSIPHAYFFDLLDGMESDLAGKVHRTFDDLYGYCYQAAAVVGMTTIHVLGFEQRAAIPLAEKCGIAFQLTNIMRDVADDAAMGRVYFPTVELEQFGLSREDLLERRISSDDRRFQRFMAFQWRRADRYYEESAGLLELLSPAGRPALWAMVATYRGILGRIRSVRYAVLDRTVTLPAWKKLWLSARALHMRATGGIPSFPA